MRSALLKIEFVEKQLEGWKVLERAIPSEFIKPVAHRYGVTADHLRRWRREPLSDEAPLASGQRSPLDRTFDLMDAIFLSHPTGVAFIREAVNSHHSQLLESTETFFQPWDRREHAASLLSETVEAVNCLNLEACDEKTLKELIEAESAIGNAIKQLRLRRSIGADERRESRESAGLGEPAGSLEGAA